MNAENEQIALNPHVFDGAAHFAAGWISGCGGVLASHPFDTVKVRLQTQGVLVTPHMYTGTFNCIQHTIHREGVRGLFKGMRVVIKPKSGIFSYLAQF